MSKIINEGLTNPVWHRMLYSCTHMATVDVEGLITVSYVISGELHCMMATTGPWGESYLVQWMT